VAQAVSNICNIMKDVVLLWKQRLTHQITVHGVNGTMEDYP
jgi:hypothetical protein